VDDSLAFTVFVAISAAAWRPWRWGCSGSRSCCVDGTARNRSGADTHA